MSALDLVSPRILLNLGVEAAAETSRIHGRLSVGYLAVLPLVSRRDLLEPLLV
jgi:hypothetical protein